MEENKTKIESATKDSKENSNEVPKITVEDLKNYCNQLYVQNRELKIKLNQVMEVHTKLPFLFEILKNPEFFDDSVVARSSEEITAIMFAEEDKTTEKPKDKPEE